MKVSKLIHDLHEQVDELKIDNKNAHLYIDDLKKEARKKVPKAFHDYVLSGSWTESTLESNTNDFKKISFKAQKC